MAPIISLNNYEIKSLKLIIKIKSIINLFNKAPFILFFYYDFFNSSERIILRKLLNTYNLKTLIIKNEEVKQISSLFKDNKLYNLLIGNTLFIFHKNNEIIDKNIIKILINHPKLTLIGGKWFNKIYRIQQIKKLIELDDLIVKKSLIRELLQLSYILKNILSRI